MAELTIDPATIRKALDEFVEVVQAVGYPDSGSRLCRDCWRRHCARDGTAWLHGNELLTFEDGTLGLAFNLDAREIGVVILGDFAGIEEGQEVRRTGEVLSVPVGDGYLGRTVDPLGNPIDGLGEIKGMKGVESSKPRLLTLCTVIPSTNRCPPA